MTEDEAKTKWCPQARVSAGIQYNAANRRSPTYRGDPPLMLDGGNCIGSGCMAWRETSTQHGYCGLAGRPRV